MKDSTRISDETDDKQLNRSPPQTDVVRSLERLSRFIRYGPSAVTNQTYAVYYRAHELAVSFPKWGTSIRDSDGVVLRLESTQKLKRKLEQACDQQLSYRQVHRTLDKLAEIGGEAVWLTDTATTGQSKHCLHVHIPSTYSVSEIFSTESSFGEQALSQLPSGELLSPPTSDSRFWKLETLLTLHPRQFEHLVARLWDELGYKTTVTKRSGDDGVDVIATAEEQRVVIQTKRNRPSSQVTSRVVQRTIGTIPQFRADQAIVVTTSEFSPSARKSEKASNGLVQLVNGDMLLGMLATADIEKPKEDI
ncbi:Restriction endonuclease [Halogranum rubrum]|uniref:Restriction endonuclease n=1 Tax=Halogranum rubrum TaxID=553466 RepID=A0A1I4BC44_9EURY|nr:restriction endonuclease [Halogranum rubrum]SFK65531.1 Restriction endonuclease [Halogranum rubrum]